MKSIYVRLLKPFNFQNSLFILFLILIVLALTLPILTQIPPHPDEYQFFANAFSIMNGKELANYLHVAFTEYALTGFLTLVNVFTRSGVNFPQGSPSLVTIYYGRVFGLLLYFLTYFLGLLIVQKGDREIKLRAVFYSIFYFSSLGIFERFFRVNSDSMMVFLFANYFVLSIFLNRRKAPLYYFFLVNALFLFALSFTNLKTLYLALPLLIINTVNPLFLYPREAGENRQIGRISRFLPHFVFLINLAAILALFIFKFKFSELLIPFIIFNGLNPALWPRDATEKFERSLLTVYKAVLYALGLISGVLYLWSVFIPKPFNAHNFWYQVKNTIVFGTEFDFDYPGQSYRSWLVYLYDLLVEYLGVASLLILALLILAVFKIHGLNFFKEKVKKLVKTNFLENVKRGDLSPATEPILILCFLAYYVGISARVVHWSRWGVPLGFIFIILMGILAEKLFYKVSSKFNFFHRQFFLSLLGLGFLALLPRFFLTADLAGNGFPKTAGHEQTRLDVEKFLTEAAINPSEASTSAVWFTGPTNNVGNISLEKLGEPLYKNTKYLLWPQWNLGLLYTLSNVDRSTHNQRAFIDKYAEKVSFRFPTTTAKYTNGIKDFAWNYLGLTYSPELESLIEPQYAVVKLKEITHPISYDYVVGFNDLSHYYVPSSEIFNLNNLYESYMFPPCYSNPAVANVATGQEVAPDPVTGSRTLGLHCHGLRFRVAFKGIYNIQIQGLPDDSENSRLVYSAYGYNYDPRQRLISFLAPQTFISVEFGVAAKESFLPNLKFHVYYQELTREQEDQLKANQK